MTRSTAHPSLIARLGFDVSPDGKRLLMVQEVKTDVERHRSVAVIHNWIRGFSN